MDNLVRAEQQSNSDRGVFEEARPLEGLREVRVVSTGGQPGLIVFAKEGWLDDRLIRDLRMLLDRMDPKV